LAQIQNVVKTTLLGTLSASSAGQGACAGAKQAIRRSKPVTSRILLMPRNAMKFCRFR